MLPYAAECSRSSPRLLPSFDATYLYEYTLLMLYNLVFTSLPVAILGILDQDIDAKTSLAYPQLYRRGILGKEWTRRRFFGYMLDGLYQSAVAFFVPYLVFAWSTTLTRDGHDFALWELGTTVAACAVTAANLFVGLNIRYWTWMVFVIIIGSTLLFHVWIAIYSQFQTFFFQNEVICEYAPHTLGAHQSLTSVALVLLHRPLRYGPVLVLDRPRSDHRDRAQVPHQVHPVDLFPARQRHHPRAQSRRTVGAWPPERRRAVLGRVGGQQRGWRAAGTAGPRALQHSGTAAAAATWRRRWQPELGRSGLTFPGSFNHAGVPLYRNVSAGADAFALP